MPAFKDLTGLKFGRLTVICRSKNEKGKQTRWLCKCDCGKEKTIIGVHLTNGMSKSCGCMQKEIVSKIKTINGLNSKSRLYKIFCGMKQRCYNTNEKAYHNYGGRGITVCDEWLNNTLLFIAWAKSNGYKNNLTIERINNDKGYSPDNCKWATRKEQNRNRRDNVFITFKKETKNLIDWAEYLNMNHHTIMNRIKSGWTVKDALTVKPVVGRNQTNKYRKEVSHDSDE
jgi:hypothetical protein